MAEQSDMLGAEKGVAKQQDERNLDSHTENRVWFGWEGSGHWQVSGERHKETKGRDSSQ